MSFLREMQKFISLSKALNLLVLTGLFFLLSLGLQAQTISGTISSSDNESVIGAYITSGIKGASSDIDGKYTLALASGTHEISCSFIGLKTQTKTITLSLGENLTLNFKLEPEARQSSPFQNPGGVP